MFKKLLPYFLTILASVVISVSLSALVLFQKPTGYFPRGVETSEMLFTDEQAAEQTQQKEAAFSDLSGEELAKKALVSICNQLHGRFSCGPLADYEYYAQKEDGNGDAAVALWFSPQGTSKPFSKPVAQHLMCDFRNEQWVICDFTMGESGRLKRAYARTVTEFDLGVGELKLRRRERSRPIR